MCSTGAMRDFLKFEDFYNKETGEGVHVVRGNEIIRLYFNSPECTFLGRRVKKEKYSIAHMGSYYYIDSTGVVKGEDYLVVKGSDNIEILRAETFKKLYSKYKRIKSKFLKIEKEFSSEYVELNTIKEVRFVKKDNEKNTSK